jgi:hypothetical protein
MAETGTPDTGVAETGTSEGETDAAVAAGADALAESRPVTRANSNEAATSDDSCLKGRVFMVGQRLLQVWIKRADSPLLGAASRIRTRLVLTLTGQRR